LLGLTCSEFVDKVVVEEGTTFFEFALGDFCTPVILDLAFFKYASASFSQLNLHPKSATAVQEQYRSKFTKWMIRKNSSCAI